jgi:hypothetical protein
MIHEKHHCKCGNEIPYTADVCNICLLNNTKLKLSTEEVDFLENHFGMELHEVPHYEVEEILEEIRMEAQK